MTADRNGPGAGENGDGMFGRSYSLAPARSL